MKKKQIGKKQVMLLLIAVFVFSTIFHIASEGVLASNQEKHTTGCLPITQEEYEKIPTITVKQSRSLLPSKDLTHLFPTPGNQGNQGSCTAWAVAYALKSYQEKLELGWSLNSNNHLFSPAYIYNQLTNNGSGISIYDAMKLVQEQGVCTLQDMPYKDDDFLTRPNSVQTAKAARYKAASCKSLTNGDIIAYKSWLANNNAIIIQLPVYPDFDDIDTYNQVYDNYNGDLRGHHAVCIVGYDDSKRAFKFINSWGIDWGLNGFGYISYDLVQQGSNALIWNFVMEDATTLISPGHFEEVSAEYFKGWAVNDNDVSNPIQVHFYIYDSNNSLKEAIPVIANQYRPDVGYHSFNHPFSWRTYKPGRYQINAYAIYGTNPALTVSPKYYDVRSSEGTVDYIGTTGISGWAWKPDAPNEPIEAHVYIYDSSNRLIYSKPLIANQYRSDLKQAGKGNGQHAYSLNVPWSTLTKGNLNVKVYSVDSSGHSPQIYSGIYNNK